jgi:hypothetical protein
MTDQPGSTNKPQQQLDIATRLERLGYSYLAQQVRSGELSACDALASARKARRAHALKRGHKRQPPFDPAAMIG